MTEQIHILYIDDNPMDRALVRDSLEKEHGGFVLTEAKSQEEFEQLIHEKVYDLVLTDFNILGFDGLKVLEIVKKVTPETPVILVTGTGTEEIAVEAMKQGASDYVIKTAIHIKRLPKTIEAVLVAKHIRFEKENVQNELFKMNRVYAVISQINQLIVRTDSSDNLFREACNIALNFGGFHMAWIGLVDEKLGIIKPYCWAGNEMEYLANIDIPIAGNSPSGNGPVGKAFKNKKYYVSNNVMIDPWFEPWREEAFKRNYKSIISLPIKLKNNVIAVFSIYSSEIDFFDKQEIELFVEVAGDISFAIESIQKDQELIISNNKYKSLYENAPLPYQSLNEDGIVLDVNPAWLKLMGYMLDEVIGKWYGDLLHPDSRTVFVENFPVLKTCGMVKDVPFKLRQKDGSYISISLNGLTSYLPDGTFKQTHCVFKDVTAQLDTIEKLKNSENQKSVILETTSEGFWIVDIEGRFLDVNNSYCMLTGYSRDELLTMSIADVEIVDANKDIKERIRKITIQGTDRFESKHRAKNGSILEFEISINYLENDQLFFVFLHDITQRKANERLLLKSEKELQKAQNIAHLGSWYLDLATNEVQWTEELYKMYGFDSKLPPPLYSEHDKLFTPESWDLLSSSLAKTFKTGDSYELELKTVRQDGGNGWIWARAETVTDSKGMIIGFWGAAQDITQRKKIEEDLKESEDKYRLIAENSSDVIWVLNLNQQKYKYISPAIFQLRGLTVEEAMNESLSDSLTPESLEFVTDLLNRDVPEFIKNPENPYYSINEVRQPHKNGSLIWVEISSTWRLTDVGEIEMLGVSRNIDERKHNEEKLKTNQMLFKSIIDGTTDAVYIKDENGTYVVFNKSASEMIGRKEEDVIGKKDTDIFTVKEGEIVMESDRLIMNSGCVNTIEECVTLADGEKHFFLSTKGPLINNDGDVSGLFGVARDITERKQAEVELIAAKEKAEESDRLKSAFLANMSHEIRTPMNGILGFAELLKEPDLSGAEQLEYIQIIEKAGARMLNIINDIVNISKIESGLMDLNIQESVINDQLEYIYTFFKPEIEGKGLQIVFKNTLPTKTIIKTDREKLYAILTNLIKNAIKYTEKGTIEFGCSLKKDKEPIEIEFYIKDTGIGVHAERQEAIFERFIQADISDKFARQGAGLGLSISKAYAEMLGGKIWLESEEGKGSCFYFTLPYQTDILNENKTNLIKSTANLECSNLNLKILIAEDDETSEMLLSIALQKYGQGILKTITGKETVTTCFNNPDIDLILMDIQMPEMNGYEVTKEIRKFNKQVIIIAQTAFALEGDKEKAIEAGCNDYISKPISTDELNKLILKYFGS